MISPGRLSKQGIFGQENGNNMKKLMSLMLGLALALTTVTVSVAQETKKSGGKKKSGKKKKGETKKGGTTSR